MIGAMLSNDANLIFFHTAALDLWDDYRSWILAATGFYGELFFSITTTFNVMIIIYIWTNNVVHHQKTLEKTRFFFPPRLLDWTETYTSYANEEKRPVHFNSWPLLCSPATSTVYYLIYVLSFPRKKIVNSNNLKCISLYILYSRQKLDIRDRSVKKNTLIFAFEAKITIFPKIALFFSEFSPLREVLRTSLHPGLSGSS